MLLNRLSEIPDPRNPRKVRPKLTVLRIQGILCFAFQMSSGREANREMTRPMFEANLRKLFADLEELPHNDTLARLLSRIQVDEIEQAHLAFQNGMVIPLLSEVLSDSQGDSQRNKQDCEQKAFKRLAGRLKECFSHLPIVVLLDGLYPKGPLMGLCRQHNWDFMIVLQDGSLPSVWEEIAGLKALQRENRLPHKWGDRRQHFWWVNDIEYGSADPAAQREKKLKLPAVTCEESWEEIAPGSTELVPKASRHVWVSAEPWHRGNVHQRCNRGARHRWGIESGLLVEKHQGYQYEHCFSYEWQAMRGYHYLMRLGPALNVLARHSYALAKYVRDLGVRGLIALLRNTIAGPWLNAEDLQQIATAPCQIRLE